MWIVIESVKADFTCQRCFLAQELGLGRGVLELPTTDSSQVQLVQVQVHRGQGVHEECELSLKADREADLTCSMFSPLRPLLVARYYPPQEFNQPTLLSCCRTSNMYIHWGVYMEYQYCMGVYGSQAMSFGLVAYHAFRERDSCPSISSGKLLSNCRVVLSVNKDEIGFF